MAFLQTDMASSPTGPAPQSSAVLEPRPELAWQRSQRQLGLFFVGAGFFGASMAITRRSLLRRYKASIPRFYQPSNRPSSEVNGAMEAFEALNIATINVFSIGMMLSGGLLWAFDIASLDDMRRRVRINMGVNPSGEDKEAEEQMEEWFATVLARKEFKHLKGEQKAHGLEDEADKNT